MTNHPLVGREREMNALRSYKAGARFSNSQVISVWGIAGIGKSALVRTVYYDSMLNSNQFNKYRWVDVSHPLNLWDFSRSLIQHHSESDPIEACRELLSQYQCLIVIDDLQSREEWDLIQATFLPRHSASVIIVITTKAGVAAYCNNSEKQVFNVKGLEDAAAMDLLRKEVHRKNPWTPLNDYQNEDLEEVILKCGGIPEVIVCIADLLATETVTLMDTVNSLNHKFMYHLETNTDFESQGSLFDWMHSYFNSCSISLKACIFYLSIFPRDYHIRGRRLVWRWIAEGYTRESSEESAVRKGEKFFSDLLSMSIIHQKPGLVATACNDTRLASCLVNGFFYEYIVSRRKEDNHAFVLGPNDILTTEDIGQHLVILSSWERDRIGFESIDFSWLRSLTVFGNWDSFFISTSMMMLLVLDLEDALGVKDDDLEKIVKVLRGLKFLSLRGCSEIFHLPSSLGDLSQLQTLDVRHTSIVTLPESITKLQKIQYIRASTKISTSTPQASSRRLLQLRRGPSLVGVKVPRWIGKLSALHTLGVVNVVASGGRAIAEDIKKLTQLRKLGVSGINKHNCKKFFFAISCLVHLESLLVQFDEDSQSCLDNISLPWEKLQSLTLHGIQNKLPLGNYLNKLRKLDLEMDNLQEIEMQYLGKLPELSILRLQVKQLEDGKLLFLSRMEGLELSIFIKVKILEITCRSSRLHVIFEYKSMNNVELLKIDCSNAAYQLTGLHNLYELKEVTLKGTADEAIKTSLQYQLANHPNEPTVNLSGLP
ncbi:disease resistance protein RGA4-like [Lolium rigidum]|uniref:disease resistance protein RGA4-like n=1 Tax=Lolium rigidum TaxID=89674 RepID=UPI001F5CA077|nr:disease resistance protein RGA4-like [Lolium rigidum]